MARRYAGLNALVRARLAAAVVEERLAARSPGLRRRYDFIGALSVFGGDGDVPADFAIGESTDIRMRLAIGAGSVRSRSGQAPTG